MHRLSLCRFGHGHTGGQFFRVLHPAHHGINGTEKVQLLPPGVAGPTEALPACTSPLQGSGNGFFFPRTISHRAYDSALLCTANLECTLQKLNLNECKSYM
jgi:hypothetical protein